jgi:hypothetical protein
MFNNQIRVLGKLRATGKPTFPLAFQTAREDFLLINRKGEIFNEKGGSLGYIVPRK